MIWNAGVVEVFGQTLSSADLAVIGLLVVLEGVLSIDNALVLGLLAKRLPKHQQPRALTYGLIGALVFRVVSIGLAAYLLRWRIVKLLGGGYLIYVAVKDLFFESKDEHPAHDAHEAQAAVDKGVAAASTLSPHQPEFHPFTHPAASRRFWSTVLVIELTDIAFAVDSILAAIALVGPAPAGYEDAPHPKLWVVITGGFLGVILMRFAAVIFIRLLEKFPRFETAAYLLVAIIGGKLLLDWYFNTPDHPHTLDFHTPGSAAFIIFWVVMVLCFCVGFLPSKAKPPPELPAH